MSRENRKSPFAPSIPEVFDMHADDIGSKLRVCMPGYIKTYDSEKRTASVVLGENLVLNDGTVVTIKAPLLDVPVLTLQGGGVHVAFPIKASDTSLDGKGDECLVIFADFNIDAWHAFGGQQTPPDARQHDISDGFAIVGPNSLANPIVTFLEDSEGGVATAEAKMAIDNETSLISISNTTKNLSVILTTLVTELSTLNITLASMTTASIASGATQTAITSRTAAIVALIADLAALLQ